MFVKLTDTELVMMSAAARRDDHDLEPPKSMKASTAAKVAAKLIASGLVREIKAKKGAAAWRRDEKTGQAYSLKLTAAGLKAIVVDVEDPRPTASATRQRLRTMFRRTDECRGCSQRGDWEDCRGCGNRDDPRDSRDQARDRETARGDEDRASDRAAPTRSGRELGRTDRRHGLAAAYRASGADRPSPSRL